MPTAPIPDAAKRNIAAIRELEAELVRRRTRADRLTDRVTGFVGSLPFVVIQAAAVLAWVVANLGVVPGVRPFDPFPFAFLNAAVCVEAIFLSTFVLMAQNRQNREAEHWNHLQLQVNLLAEQEATKMLEMLRAICKRLGMEVTARDAELGEMIQSTQVEVLARELQQARGSVAGSPEAEK